ncbi:MAG: hypothetical protein IJ344_01115 [Clostridia bacterium]|nr:hypothetical protein [Clostridia bacterium]
MERTAFYKKQLKECYPAILRARAKCRAFLFLKMLLLEVLALFLLYTSGKATIVLGVILCVLPILLLKPQTLFKKSYVGRVMKKEDFSKRVRTGGLGLFGRTGMKEIQYMRVHFSDEKGKVHRLELPARYEQIYSEATAVLSLSGLPYPIPLHPKEKTVCPLCGTVTSLENGNCGGNCGLPLVVLGSPDS